MAGRDASAAWREIARENLVAAKSLAMDSRWRSSVSRAYYAAYASVSGALQGSVQFRVGRKGPSHERLPQLVVTYLTELTLYQRRRLSEAARRLYRYRLVVDYEPLKLVDQELDATGFAGHELHH